MSMLTLSQADEALRGIPGAANQEGTLQPHAFGCDLATISSMQTPHRTSPAVPDSRCQVLQAALWNRRLTWEVCC